jgi:cytochrome c biogenesis protein CcdA
LASSEGPFVEIQVLPLAMTMMAGPQIMSAIILVTTERAIFVSLAFVLGVAVATIVGLIIASGIASLLGDAVSFGDSSDKGSAGTIIQIALVTLLALAAVRNYLGRKTSEPPRWLGTLQTASPVKALAIGLLVILLMPSDIIVMLTVAANLQQHDSSLVSALPFIVATVLIAALPLLLFLIFRRRAVGAMPKVRDWMNSHSWLINVGVCVLFIVLILSGD